MGKVDPVGFRRAEATKQVYSLEYDKEVQLPAETFCTPAGAMDIDSSERFLLTGHQDGYWSITDCWKTEAADGNSAYELVKKGHSTEKPRYSLSSVFWHIDSGMFSTCSWYGTVNIFDTNNTRRPLHRVGEPGFVEYVKHTVNPSNQIIIAATNRIEKTVGFIDLRYGKEVQVLPPTLDAFVPALRFSPACEHRICVGTDLGQVIEWDMRSPLRYLNCYENRNLCVTRFSEMIPAAHRYNVSSLKYSDDGRYLFSYGVDKTIHKFNTSDSNLEETVVLDCVAPKMLQYLEIHVFENLEEPIVIVPYNKYLHMVNMADGVAKVVNKLKCTHTVNGFTYNRALLKGFSYGKACTVFTPHRTSEPIIEDKLQNRGSSNVPNVLIDITDL
jgi:WD40 repeat protein